MRRALVTLGLAALIVPSAAAAQQGASGTDRWSDAVRNVPMITCVGGFTTQEGGPNRIDFSARAVDLVVALRPSTSSTEPFRPELLASEPGTDSPTRIISGLVPRVETDGFVLIQFPTGLPMHIPFAAVRGFKARDVARSEKDIVKAQELRCRLQTYKSAVLIVDAKDGGRYDGKPLALHDTDFDLDVETVREITIDGKSFYRGVRFRTMALLGHQGVEAERNHQQVTLRYADLKKVNDPSESDWKRVYEAPWAPDRRVWEELGSCTNAMHLPGQARIDYTAAAMDLVLAVQKDTPSSAPFTPQVLAASDAPDLPTRTISGLLAYVSVPTQSESGQAAFFIIHAPSGMLIRVPFSALRAFRPRKLAAEEKRFINTAKIYFYLRQGCGGEMNLVLQDGRALRGTPVGTGSHGLLPTAAARDFDFDFEIKETHQRITLRYADIKKIKFPYNKDEWLEMWLPRA